MTLTAERRLYPAADAAVLDLIHDALAFGRFRVEAQPIVDLESDLVETEELLVRLVEPDGRVLPPADFIPLAEEHGLMPGIDVYVIDRAAALAGGGRRVNVNLSATTLADPHLPGEIVAAVRRHHAPPERITFEITETAAMRDMGRSRRVATTLAACGFGLALDDFGSGWGAFRYLKALPVGVLKIDQEFVRDLCSSQPSARVVRAMVAVARVLGKRTVAEGVEDAATLEVVRDLGVDAAQGFHLGRPVPTELESPAGHAATVRQIAQLRYRAWTRRHR